MSPDDDLAWEATYFQHHKATVSEVTNKYAKGANGTYMAKPSNGVARTRSRNKDRIGTRMYYWQLRQLDKLISEEEQNVRGM